MFELIFVGIIVGFLSGFFGIGGGTILVPLLLILGFETKMAMGTSVLQMVFSSMYGSYLNHKNKTLDLGLVMTIGIGGSLGALLSGLITSSFEDKTLEIIFFGFAAFALLRLFFKTKEHQTQREVNKVILFVLGFFLGAASIAIGVGGSVILVPILVGYFYVPLKSAISAGLFFVVFSSIAGFISHATAGHIEYEKGLPIAIASLLGVYIGILLKDRVNVVLQRRLLVFFYIIIVSYLGQRVFL